MSKIFIAVLLGVFLTAAVLPPAMPSSFYGVISGSRVGDLVTTNFSGYTNVFYAEGYGNVYSLNVTGGNTGDLVTFYVNGKVVGTATYREASNQRVDFSIIHGRTRRFK